MGQEGVATIGIWGSLRDLRVPLPQDRWTHLAVTYDGTYLRAYVNGEFQSMSWLVQGSMSVGRNIHVGKAFGFDKQEDYWHGMVSGLKVYQGALTAD